MQIELTVLNILLLSAVVIGIFLGGSLLIIRSENRTANRILGSLLLMISALLGIAFYLNRQPTMDCPHLFSAATPIPLLFGPLLYLYVRTKILKDHSLTLNDLIHLIPFLILLLFQLTTGFLPLGSRFNLTGIIVQDSFYVNNRMLLLNTAKILCNLGYVWGTLRLIGKNYESEASINPSFIPQQHSWLKNLSFFIGSYWLVYGMVFIYQATINQNMLYLDNLLSVSLSFITMGIGFIALQKPLVYTGPDITTNGQEKYEKSSLDNSQFRRIEQALLEAVKNRQLYLNHNLTLRDLSNALNIPSHHISQTLSQQMESNFFDFINRFRISHAKKLLLDPDFNHYTILAIAEESGFNSKASFNRAFKKFAGMTPTQYIKAVDYKTLT